MSVDGRSPAELVIEADQRSRLLMFDMDADRAPAVVRGLPALLDATKRLWEALPAPVRRDPLGVPAIQRAPRDESQNVVARLDRMSAVLTRSSAPQSMWPGAGPVDAEAEAITGLIDQAAQQVRQRDLAGVDPSEPILQRDAHENRMRSLHVVWVSAHAAKAGASELIAEAEGRTGRVAATAVAVQQVAGRLDALEQAAGQYVQQRFSRVMQAGTYQPAWDSNRLQQAVASWDVEAHRVLTGNPNAHDTHLIARTQSILGQTSSRLIDAAGGLGRVDTAAAERLQPALTATRQQWERQQTQWEDLRVPAERPDAALAVAAGEVVAAANAIVVDRNQWASAETIASRIDLDHAMIVVQQAATTNTDLASSHRDMVAERVLEVPAAGLAKLLHRNNDELNGFTFEELPARSIYANRQIPLPEKIREHLATTSNDLIDASRTASSATAGLDPVAQRQLDEDIGCPRCGSVPSTARHVHITPARSAVITQFRNQRADTPATTPTARPERDNDQPSPPQQGGPAIGR